MLAKVLKNFPENMRGLFLMCKCSFIMNYFHDAIELGQKIIQINPKYNKEVYFYVIESYKSIKYEIS